MFTSIFQFDNLTGSPEHIVHIDGVTGSSPVATTKSPGNTEFSGVSSCLDGINIALEAGLFQPSLPFGTLPVLPKIRTSEYKGVQVHFVE